GGRRLVRARPAVVGAGAGRGLLLGRCAPLGEALSRLPGAPLGGGEALLEAGHAALVLVAQRLGLGAPASRDVELAAQVRRAGLLALDLAGAALQARLAPVLRAPAQDQRRVAQAGALGAAARGS